MCQVASCNCLYGVVAFITCLIYNQKSGKITLSDLKSCKLTPVFFNTFVNVEKYLDYEQRDPMGCVKEEGVEPSPWDKYASEQYVLLVQEEQYEQENGYVCVIDTLLLCWGIWVCCVCEGARKFAQLLTSYHLPISS